MKKSRPAQALAALLAIVALSAMCAGGALPFAGTVGTPKDRVEAHATAIAIAPAIEATRAYQERVLPTIQAEEATQAKQDIETKHTNRRTVSSAWAGFLSRILDVAKWCAIVSLVFWTGRGVAEAVSGSVERAKRARAYEPVQVISDKAALLPNWQTLADPRTGFLVNYTTPHEASQEHGYLLIERETGPRVRFRLRNGERHEQTVIDAVRLLPQTLDSHTQTVV